MMTAFDKTMDLELMEKHMLKYEGGEVYLSKEYYEDGIAVLYLNHPQKRNAISGKMMVDFRRCVAELEEWKEGKSILICGLGENFCSGGDLDFARSAGTPQEGYYMSCIMQDVLKRLRRLPLISISLIHGPTLGGGAEISIFSDYILVADNVKLGFVHGKMGLTTAFGATTRLVQLVGERKALQILLTSKIYNAEECLNIGLADKIVNTSNKMEEALTFIKQHTIHHNTIIQTYKQVVTCFADDNLEKNLILERDLFYPTWGSKLNNDALAKNIKHIKKY